MSESSSGLRRHVAASGWLLGSTVISGLLSYAAVTLSARLLGTADFGLLGALVGVTSFATIALRPAAFSTTHLAAAAIARGNLRALRGLATGSLLIGAGMAAGLGAVLILLADTLGTAIHTEGLWPLALIGPLVASLACLQLTAGIVSGEQRFRALAASSVVDAGARALLMVPLIYFLGVSGSLIAYILGQLAAITFLVVSLGGLTWQFPPAHDVRRSLHTGASSVPLLVGIVLLQNGDLVLLRSYGLPGEAGVYAACASAGNLLVTLASSIYVPQFPRTLSAHREGRPTLAILLTTLTPIAGAGATAVLGSVWLGVPVVHLLFGKAFDGAGLLMPAYFSKTTALLLVGVVGQHAMATGRGRVVGIVVPPAILALVALELMRPDALGTAILTAICAAALVPILAVSVLLVRRSYEQQEEGPTQQI